jgi:hypothetical protein
LRLSHAGMLETRGADSPVSRNVLAHVALALALQGQVSEAQPLLVAEIDNFRKADGLLKFHGLHFAGIVQRLAGELPAAEALQLEAMAILDDSPRHARRRRAVETELALIALEAGDAARALERVRSWPVESLQGAPGSPADADRFVAAGRVYFSGGQRDLALQQLQAADAFWQAFAPASRWATETARRLAEVRAAAKDTDLPQ